MPKEHQTTRVDKANAWAEGLAAARHGEARAANPYIGANSELAKEWDQGWNEGS